MVSQLIPDDGIFQYHPALKSNQILLHCVLQGYRLDLMGCDRENLLSVSYQLNDKYQKRQGLQLPGLHEFSNSSEVEMMLPEGTDVHAEFVFFAMTIRLTGAF